ncbi:MAG: hypothetical protein ACC651_15900 [Candidatus Scalindua sp.]
MGMCNIDYWDWVEEFKPLPNHLDRAAGIDGFLFLPFGKQWDFVNRINTNYLWSLIVTDLDDDTVWEIVNGIHIVNIQGMLVTRVPYTEEMTIVY